jgi:large subunit ribosomal protein L9
MEVLLVKDRERLGREGDIVTVADGYARNYLIPRGFALAASDKTVKLQEKIRADRLAREAHERQEFEELAARLSNVSVTAAVKVGEDEQLYGSVNAQDIAALLEQEGFHIDRKKILLEAPLKALGVYAIEIRLHPEVTATIKLWVVKE